VFNIRSILIMILCTYLADSEDFGAYAHISIEMTHEQNSSGSNPYVGIEMETMNSSKSQTTWRLYTSAVIYPSLSFPYRDDMPTSSNKLWVYFDGINKSKNLPCNIQLQLNGPGEHIIGVKNDSIGLCGTIFINGTLIGLSINDNKKIVKCYWLNGRSSDYTLSQCNLDQRIIS
jgi:hypothetical protein